jgi:transposase
MKVHILGVDLAKNVFQLHGVDRKGRAVLVRRVRRELLLKVLGELEPCLMGIEASTGAFYWQRQFEKLGHAVKIMAPQYVKPFVRRQKNDSNDAEAICTAVQQRNMRFVQKKTLEQQDIQALHRARQRLVNHRTALISQMRGLLLDRGIAIAVSATRARRLIPKILSESNDELTEMMRALSFIMALEADHLSRRFPIWAHHKLATPERCLQSNIVRPGPETFLPRGSRP